MGPECVASGPSQKWFVLSNPVLKAHLLRPLVGRSGSRVLLLEIGAVVIGVRTVSDEAEASAWRASRSSTASGTASACAGSDHNAAALGLNAFKRRNLRTGNGAVRTRTALARAEDHAIH